MLSFVRFYIFKTLKLKTRVAPDIRPFLISGIRPDIRFRLPDIRPIQYPVQPYSKQDLFIADKLSNYTIKTETSEFCTILILIHVNEL